MADNADKRPTDDQTIIWWQTMREKHCFSIKKIDIRLDCEPVMTRYSQTLTKSRTNLKTLKLSVQSEGKEWADSSVTSGPRNHTLAEKWQLMRSVGSVFTFGTSSVEPWAHTRCSTKTASAQPSAHRRRSGTAYSSQGVSSPSDRGSGRTTYHRIVALMIAY